MTTENPAGSLFVLSVDLELATEAHRNVFRVQDDFEFVHRFMTFAAQGIDPSTLDPSSETVKKIVARGWGIQEAVYYCMGHINAIGLGLDQRNAVVLAALQMDSESIKYRSLDLYSHVILHQVIDHLDMAVNMWMAMQMDLHDGGFYPSLAHHQETEDYRQDIRGLRNYFQHLNNKLSSKGIVGERSLKWTSPTTARWGYRYIEPGYIEYLDENGEPRRCAIQGKNLNRIVAEFYGALRFLVWLLDQFEDELKSTDDPLQAAHGVQVALAAERHKRAQS